MNRVPVSQRLRDAANRIVVRMPMRPDEGVLNTDQVVSDALTLFDLADEVEALEDRVRPLSWRERRQRRRSRQFALQLRALWHRLLRTAPRRWDAHFRTDISEHDPHPIHAR